MTPGGEALGSVLAGPKRGEHPAKKQKLETAEMSLTSINPTAPHKRRQPQTQTLRQRKPSLVATRTLRNHLPEIAVVTVFACLLLASCAALPPYRSLAFSVISGTLASACESAPKRKVRSSVNPRARRGQRGARSRSPCGRAARERR